MNIRYLGTVTVCLTTAILLDTDSAVFYNTVTKDTSEGFLLEMEGLNEIYDKLMLSSNPERFVVETKHQKITITTNSKLTELFIENKESWWCKNYDLMEETYVDLGVIPRDASRLLLDTTSLIRCLWQTIAADKRGLLTEKK